jgi:S1-C subfamily serine protease
VIKAVDRSNDLALVKFEISSSPVTFRATPAEIGEDVFAVGYPYAGELGLNFTKGSVSSTTGPENDSRLLQFTAPVQPGNSGGPLLDKSGLMVGVVRALLVPAQNVNFAIHADLAVSFLRRNDIDPIMAASTLEAPSPTEIAKRAKLHTLRLTCLSEG